MKKAIQEVRRQFERFEKNREKCIDSAGKLRSLAKRAIGYIGHGDTKRAKRALGEAMRTVKDLRLMLLRHPYLHSVPALNEGLEEFVEAILLARYVTGNLDFPTPSAIGVNHEAYIGGLCDMTGEMVRIARNHPEKSASIAADAAAIYRVVSEMVVARNSRIRAKLQQLEHNVIRLEEIVSAAETPPPENRPWGSFAVLSNATDCKVKRITVHPGHRLSLQRHRRRDEHWFVVKGKGLVTLGDRSVAVKVGSSVNISRGCFHRIKNTSKSNLVLVEIQTGDYFGEDDIERVEDDYGRC